MNIRQNENPLKLLNYSAAQNVYFLSNASVIVPPENGETLHSGVFPLGLNPIPQRTSQIDMQPCLLVTHTGGSDTDASFLTASIKFPSSKITHQNKSETKWKTMRYS